MRDKDLSMSHQIMVKIIKPVRKNVKGNCAYHHCKDHIIPQKKIQDNLLGFLVVFTPVPPKLQAMSLAPFC